MQKHKKYVIKRKYAIIICVLLLLIILRLLLPFIVLKYANRSLAEIPGYFGHVNEIGISLYRGAYQLDSIYINKLDAPNGKQIEFFNSGKVDLSIEWQPLFHGRLVGKIKFFSPKLIFTKDKTEIAQVARDTDNFRTILKDFMPLKVNRFEIENGSIHYKDNTATPKVDIFFKKAHILATNLRNTSDKNEKLPSSLIARADAYGGSLTLNMKLDGMAKAPTFYMNAELKDADLASFNDFFRAYGKFDINRGTFGLYTEFAADAGKFKGYVKPFIKDLKVLGPQDSSDTFLQKIKEAIIGAAAQLLKNPRDKEIATKIPIEGTFQYTNIDNIEAIWELLRNAFIHALMPSIDNDINLQAAKNVPLTPTKHKGLLKKIFSKKKKESKS